MVTKIEIMQTYLLNLEAVNFSSSCYDTNDLSTVRGGSMMLSNIQTLLQTGLPNELGEPLSFGASQVIWEFECVEDDAERVRMQVLEAIEEHVLLKHATFVCDIVKRSDESVKDVQSLRLRNRWRQFQQPTLVPPSLDSNGSVAKESSKPYCDFDRIRPCTHKIVKGDWDRTDATDYFVSQSTNDRRTYGKKQKEKFFQSYDSSIQVVNELKHLTNHPINGHPLDYKMAVIYIDGNKQGEMAAQMSLEKLGDFRKFIQACHDDFLKHLLEKIKLNEPEDRVSTEWYFCKELRDRSIRNEIRIETLVWGGDDIVLIVPAWKGLEVVNEFFKKSCTWSFEGQTFTHSAGMVFCSHKSPIQDMKSFADNLAIQCKKMSENDIYLDLMAYEVLESFDILEPDLDNCAINRLRKRATNDSEESDRELLKELILPPDLISPLVSMIRNAKEKVADEDSKLARRQIERLSRQMQHQPLDDANFDREVTGLLEQFDIPKELMGLRNRIKLFHLTALWDYVS